MITLDFVSLFLVCIILTGIGSLIGMAWTWYSIYEPVKKHYKELLDEAMEGWERSENIFRTFVETEQKNKPVISPIQIKKL